MRQKISGLGDTSLRAHFVLVASGRSTNADTANDLVTSLEGDSAGQNGSVGRARWSSMTRSTSSTTTISCSFSVSSKRCSTEEASCYLSHRERYNLRQAVANHFSL
jgi:hypothetical protein